MRKTILLFVILISLFFTGCQSTQPFVYKEDFKPTVENSTLLYGYADDIVSCMLLVQSETGDYQFVSAKCKGNCYIFKEPIPVGTYMKYYYYRIEKSYGTHTVVSNYYGTLAGIDFVTAKPGLMYLDTIDKKTKHEDKHKIRALKQLKKEIKDTEWLSLIDKQIEENNK